MERETDSLDEVNAFRSGYRFGELHGRPCIETAEHELRLLTERPVDSRTVLAFCRGAEDGFNRDPTRYLLSFATYHRSEDVA